MSSRVLVVYASKHGHTGKVAERIGTVLRQQGLAARVARVGSDEAGILADFDAVVIGGSVHAGRHQRKLLAWISDNHVALNELPTAFFSVSLTAADDTDKAHATTAGLIDAVLADTGWAPTTTQAVAGALQFHEYNLPTRVLMRAIARRRTGAKPGGDDVEYTDWQEVARFARRFALLLQPAVVHL